MSNPTSHASSQARARLRRKKCIAVSILGMAIFIILLAYVAFGDEVKPTPTLKLSYVIFRHGDRNPTETYKNDPHDDIRNWPGGWGALTKKGKVQMYNLGKFLKVRYMELIGHEYSSDRILVRSSDNDRCLMSVGALLAGLLPPSPEELWLEELKWQPIPVHATPRNLDKLIVVKKPCSVYDEELKNAYQSIEILQVDEENLELYQYLTQNTGQNVSSVLDVEFLYNTLEIEDKKGLKLPDWTASVYPDKMRRLAEISVAVFTHTQKMKRLVGGPLINDIREKMVKKSKHQLNPDRSFFLISGHDMTLINVLRALAFDERWKPDIGASLLFELHATQPVLDSEGYYVKILYMNSSDTTNPVPLHLPGCEDPCMLETFLSQTEDVAITPIKWEEECSSHL